MLIISFPGTRLNPVCPSSPYDTTSLTITLSPVLWPQWQWEGEFLSFTHLVYPQPPLIRPQCHMLNGQAGWCIHPPPPLSPPKIKSVLYPLYTQWVTQCAWGGYLPHGYSRYGGTSSSPKLEDSNITSLPSSIQPSESGQATSPSGTIGVVTSLYSPEQGTSNSASPSSSTPPSESWEATSHMSAVRVGHPWSVQPSIASVLRNLNK